MFFKEDQIQIDALLPKPGLGAVKFVNIFKVHVVQRVLLFKTQPPPQPSKCSTYRHMDKYLILNKELADANSLPT